MNQKDTFSDVGDEFVISETTLEKYTGKNPDVIIPDGITIIGDGAFSFCDVLKRVTIGKGVTSIGDGAFENCESLTSVTIPVGVKIIKDRAFVGCENLSKIHYSGTKEEWDKIEIGNENYSLETCEICE